MACLVFLHLRDDGATFVILRRQLLEMAVEMAFDLAFGLGQDSHVPLVSEKTESAPMANEPA